MKITKDNLFTHIVCNATGLSMYGHNFGQVSDVKFVPAVQICRNCRSRISSYVFRFVRCSFSTNDGSVSVNGIKMNLNSYSSISSGICDPSRDWRDSRLVSELAQWGIFTQWGIFIESEIEWKILNDELLFLSLAGVI